VRSVLVKLSRLRVPRANCTVKRSPMKSEPWKAMSKISNCVEPGKLGSYAAIPGTTSRASIASLYSMNPKPFMSLISVISPVPWVLKCDSTSALVAIDGCQSDFNVAVEPSRVHCSDDATYHCEGGCPDTT